MLHKSGATSVCCWRSTNKICGQKTSSITALATGTYINPRSLQLLVNKQVDDEDKELVGAGERAWKTFVAYVTTTIIDQPETITNINVLCTKYVECLNAEGIIKEIYRADHLKSRLKRHFGDDLTFHRPKKRNVCEYVFSSSVPAGPLVEKCALAMQAADDAAEDSVPQAGSPLLAQSSLHSPWPDLFRAALFLRGVIMAMCHTMPFPPRPRDLAEDMINVPDGLYNFIAWLLIGDDGSEPVSTMLRIKVASEDDRRCVLSFSQDLIHGVTHGRVKTPKHVALPMAVKHLTGSTQVITLLNRFGNGQKIKKIKKIKK